VQAIRWQRRRSSRRLSFSAMNPRGDRRGRAFWYAEKSLRKASREEQMRKKRIQGDQNSRGEQQLGSRAEDSGSEMGLASAKELPMPQSHRELGHAIFKIQHPAIVGAELLDKNNEDRNAPTRLKSLQAFADWMWGAGGGEAHDRPPRIIWDIPGPPYEPPDPELEKLEGGEK
jgi:hypothetical protein